MKTKRDFYAIILLSKTEEDAKVSTGISTERILEKLDSYLHKNDYAGAERHLLYWLEEAKSTENASVSLSIYNELMGLYRKLGRREEALYAVRSALSLIDKLGISHQVGAATTSLNAATVYKAFGMADDALPLFEGARAVYERALASDDARLAGLYNNMGLCLVDLCRYDEAKELYVRAIDVLKTRGDGRLEIAITYLNMASGKESELGLAEADEEIGILLAKARALLEGFEKRDGYYAFVCEKCASVFGYYGHFAYEGELLERARRIYEGT